MAELILARVTGQVAVGLQDLLTWSATAFIRAGSKGNHHLVDLAVKTQNLLSLIMGHHDYAEGCRVRHHSAGIFHGYNCFRTDGRSRHCQKDLLPFGHDTDLIVERVEVGVKYLGSTSTSIPPTLGIFLKSLPFSRRKRLISLSTGRG